MGVKVAELGHELWLRSPSCFGADRRTLTLRPLRSQAATQMPRYYWWDVDSNKNWRRKEWNVPKRDDKSNTLVIAVSLSTLRDYGSNRKGRSELSCIKIGTKRTHISGEPHFYTTPGSSSQVNTRLIALILPHFYLHHRRKKVSSPGFSSMDQMFPLCHKPKKTFFTLRLIG